MVLLTSNLLPFSLLWSHAHTLCFKFRRRSPTESDLRLQKRQLRSTTPINKEDAIHTNKTTQGDKSNVPGGTSECSTDKEDAILTNKSTQCDKSNVTVPGDTSELSVKEDGIHTNEATQGDKSNVTVPGGTSEFSTNKVFHSRQDLIDWVQKMGRSIGYVIVIRRSKTKPSGILSKVIFKCDRGGIYKSNKISSRATNTKKINCPFGLIGKYSSMNDCWTLRVICETHNHDPALNMEGHPYAMRLSEKEVQLVEDLSKKNVRPHDILSTLKEQNIDNVSTLRTVYNARQKLRRDKNKI